MAINEVSARLSAAKLFRIIDEDKNGAISFTEFLNYKQAREKMTEAKKVELRKEFDSIDKDKNGSLDFDEMISWFMKSEEFTKNVKLIQDKMCAAASKPAPLSELETIDAKIAEKAKIIKALTEEIAALKAGK
jgi:Ca2+-binding EF-hand superfamily protein